MLSFAANFWPEFWMVTGIGAALTVLLTVAIGSAWSPRRRTAADATLLELAAAYNISNREHDREHAIAA
jgi:hypothetical protein